MSTDPEQHKRFQRIRRLKRILRPLPRRATIHRYPLLKYFSSTAKKRYYLWSFRKKHIFPAIYAGCILSLLPVYGLQVVLAFIIALLIRCNLMVITALQFITNPITAVPLYILCYKIGNLFVKPFADVNVNTEAMQPKNDENLIEILTQILKSNDSDHASNMAEIIIYWFLTTSLGGIVLGALFATIISLFYRRLFTKKQTSKSEKTSSIPSID